MKELIKVLTQILVIVMFWALGMLCAKLIHSTIPGSIWAIFFLILALGFNLISLKHVEDGANAILKELVFLFLPLVMTVMQYKTLFLTDGWKIVISIFLGTILVMTSTSITIHLLYQLKRSKTI